MTAEDFARIPALALDTEFVWTKTYFARLGLVQAAPGNGFDRALLPSAPPAAMQFRARSEAEAAAILLDPHACPAAPVKAALESAGVAKILHDADQDLRHLARWTGTAAAPSVFDTRAAAGFCGLPSTLSLAALLEETSGVELAKTETRTDWCRRPLSPEQLDYAAQDVAWLEEAARELVRRAEKRGTAAWLFEELASRETPDRVAEPSVEEAARAPRPHGA
ncbi:MAG: ribonuclease D, partial [Kiritimatiellae bacterium]|nr:ribonuclease D [Kiritimatiellia bacterium]